MYVENIAESKHIGNQTPYCLIKYSQRHTKYVLVKLLHDEQQKEKNREFDDLKYMSSMLSRKMETFWYITIWEKIMFRNAHLNSGIPPTKFY